MGFRKPATKVIGAKILVYGGFGSGKTLFALSFPNSAAIDAENGLTNYEHSPRGKNLRLVDNSQSFKGLEESIEFISENHKEEGIEALIVDSETKVYNNIEQAVMNIEEKRARKKGREVDDTNLSMRSYGRIRYVGTKLQNLKIDLTSQGVHMISVAQAKAVKKKVGEEYVVDHYVPMMNKDAEYDYDIVVFCYREEDPIDGGYKYFARIEKDRTETFEAGTVKEGGVSYDDWKDYYEGMRNSGKEILGSKFVEDTDKDHRGYESDSKEEANTLKSRVMKLMTSLEGADKKAFAEEFKSIKIADLESMTEKQREKVEALLKKYED